jgi:hypothetical protein
MVKDTIRTGDRVRAKSAEREGTVVESDAFSLVYRAVRWDDGGVDGQVRISDIEKVGD